MAIKLLPESSNVTISTSPPGVPDMQGKRMKKRAIIGFV
jgi:hypothetical protein